MEKSAAFPAASGLEGSDRVAVILSNSTAYLELFYSTAMAGVRIVPLNNRWGIEDVVFSLTDSGAKALVADDRFVETAQLARGRVPGLTLMYAGYLYILDRKKDMIKAGRENVYLPEVESMIVSHDEFWKRR